MQLLLLFADGCERCSTAPCSQIFMTLHGSLLLLIMRIASAIKTICELCRLASILQ